jgi:fructuronate reductase
MTTRVAFTGYERAALQPTVVHIGPGVFHRAHQAVYCDAVLRTGSPTGAVWGISLRSAAVRRALEPQGFVYHVVERAPEASNAADVVRPVGALLGVDVAAHDVVAAPARLSDQAVTVATITVTEHGYCTVGPGGALDLSRPEIEHDLNTPHAPCSLPGLLLEALVRRRAAGAAPFTIASCDNLPSNGRATARAVRELAECRDPSIAAWVDANVAFPASMVDRMVPATTTQDRDQLRRDGIVDAWPVVTEPFSQWVLEDEFPTGRPPWERAGVELVTDVTRHEQAKLRILNAAHSALAYWGLLAGHHLVADAVVDSVLGEATRDLLVTEVLPTLAAPLGWDLRAYAEQVLDRFGNKALGYTTAKVAADGSQKLPVRLVPTIRALLTAGAPAPRCAQVLAAWVTCMAGPRAGTFAVEDEAVARSDPSRALSGEGWPERATAALLGLPGFPEAGQPADLAFRTEVLEHVRQLGHVDVRRVLSSPGRARSPLDRVVHGGKR